MCRASGRGVGGARTVVVATAVLLLPGTPALATTIVPPIVDEPATDPDDSVIAALHEKGDTLFERDDYRGAHGAWLDALGRVAQGPDDAAYRISLVSLIVSAAVAAFALDGDATIVGETLQLVDATLSDASLDPALAEILEHSRSRLLPLIDPIVQTPSLPTPPVPRPSGTVTLVDAQVRPRGPDPALVLIIAGAAATFGGIAAVAAGTEFKPRAINQVEDSGDSLGEGLDFVNAEIRKGQAWIGAGSVVAGAGLAMVTTGGVLLARRRRPGAARLGLAASPRAVNLSLRGRF